MNESTIKILFLHGLDSSKDSTKFHAIHSDNKFCIEVDYRNLNFATVQAFYSEIIAKIKPQLLVGHCLGGYWALKMSAQHGLAAVVANPNLSPDFRDDYPPINEQDLDHDIPQMAYLELGDEILDMNQVLAQLEPFMLIETFAGGHHRLEHPENTNSLIEQVSKQLLSATL